MNRSWYRNLRLYVFGAWFSYRALYAWVKPMAYISVKVAFPVFQIMLFVFMGRFAGLNNEAYIVIGNLLLLTATNGVEGVSMTIGGERNFRTLPYLIGSPAPRAPLFLGRVLFNVIDGLFTVVAAIAIAALLLSFDLSRTNFPLLIFCVLLMSFTSSGLGLVLGTVSLVTREGWTISSSVHIALYILCGVNFPVEMLPGPLQAIAYALPLTRGIAASRQVLAGADWQAITPLIAGETVVGLIYAIIGYELFRRVEKWSLVTGQLEAV